MTSTCRTMLPLVLLAASLPACGDSGGGTGNEGTASNTGGPGVTGVSATGTDTGSGSEGATGSTAGSESNGNSNSATDTDVAPTTGEPDATGSTGGTGSTSTGEVDPDTSSTSPFGSETTFDSFGDTTAGETCEQKIDIVFVMDVSTSMLGILQKLEDEILTVDAKLNSLEVKPDVNYGLVVFVDDTLIINGGAPYADVQALKMDFNKWWNFTQSNSQVNGGGSNGDWPENTIDALFTAANAFQWRPMEETLRLVIHCTDDTFGEKGAVQSGIAIQHTYDETVQSLQDRQVRVFSFADNDKTGGPGNNEDVSMGFFTPYNGKTPIPEATDGGAFNINLVNANQLSLSAAINESVEASLCMEYIPQ